jgi:hypothetical protein
MEVAVENIVKVYSGKPGCGCGCRGNYFTDERNIKRVVKAMNARQDEVKEEVPGIFSVEDEKRFFWAYTQE